MLWPKTITLCRLEATNEMIVSEKNEKIAPEAVSSANTRPLAGLRAWIISDGRAGHLAITLGIAEALGVRSEIKPVAARWPLPLLAPWGPADRGFIDSLLAEPWPAIALGAGRQTVPVIRALKRRSGGAIFTVIGQDPKTSAGDADLIWVPEHDGRRGGNIVSTLTPPHRFSPTRLAALREAVPAEISALPSPRIALFLGGAGGGYSWPAAEIERFAERLRCLAAQGPSFLITPSRRTPPALAQAVASAMGGAPHWFWDGAGENPYAAFLAHADAFIVTADSVNMAGEAAATGRPIHVFHPAGGRTKFHRYHAALQAYGATRPLSETTALPGDWRYAPLDAAAQVAAAIAGRWRASPASGYAQG